VPLTTIEALFDVEYGNKLDMNKMDRVTDGHGVAFIGRRGANQGVSGYVAKANGVEPYPAGLITVALGGSRLLASFVQQVPFYTAQNVAVLTPKDPTMPTAQRLYYAACITRNRWLYSAFGREANRTLGILRVPDATPAWVSDALFARPESLREPVQAPMSLVDVGQWGRYPLLSLFTIAKGRRMTKHHRQPGRSRFIGASWATNGITDHVGAPPQFPAGVLTVPYNGNSVGWAFYQDQSFLASDDIHVLAPRDPQVDRFALLFVATVVRYERYRFTYGFKWNMDRMAASTVRLPMDVDGRPDWGYMSRYMRGLPFSSAI